MTFSSLGLNDAVLKAVEDSGYTNPTPIQVQAIPEVLKGRDIIGIAQTGTGKTASFTLPMITALSKGRARARMPRGLILAPTRELAAQVAESFEKYGQHTKFTTALLIGGVSFADQEAKLDRGVDVLIATPGRLLDHFERGKVLLTGVQILVIDEADRMLDMGFIPDVEKICSKTPFTRQTLFFSATMAPEIKRLTDQFLSNPVQIEVARVSSAAETVKQGLCTVPAKDKREALRGLLRSEEITNAIIFCNRKRDIGVLTRSLERHGFSVGCLHGDMDQHSRTKMLDSFRDGKVTLMVASDVAARGLDIPAVSHVFNFDVPIHAEDYVHRIGRTGRAGRSGAAYTLATPGDTKYVSAIESLLGRSIPAAEVPGYAAEDEAETAAGGSDERDAGSRDTGSRRGKRGRGRDATGDAASERENNGPSSGRTPRHQRETAPASGGAGSEERARRKNRRRRDEPAEETIVGMGEYTPAFLLRPVFPRKSDSNSESNTEDAA